MRPDASGPDAPKKSRIMLKALGEAFTIITLNDVSSKVVSMDGIMINRSPGIGLNAAQTLKSNIRQTLLAQARPHQMPKSEHRSKTRPTHCSNRIDRPSEHAPASRLGTVPTGSLNTVKLAAKMVQNILVLITIFLSKPVLTQVIRRLCLTRGSAKPEFWASL